MNFAQNALFFFGLFSCWMMWTVLAEKVDGQWTPFSALSTPCSKECDGGRHFRVRTCSNPKPEESGKECPKDDETLATVEIQEFTCNENSCQSGNYTSCECGNCTVGRCEIFAKCGPTDEDICTGSQKESMWLDCSTWNKTTCPSPCLSVTCPEFGVCKDLSTEEAPKTKCSCTMGYTLNDDETACLRPPPTLPTKRPIPTMAEGQKKVATVLGKTASIVLIIFVGITLILFVVLRVFTPDRVIQMNMEIALILAHCFLMYPAATIEDQVMCKVVSIAIHFFFTACFNFMMLEAIYMYSLIAYVVKRDGMFTKAQNIVIGWGLAVIVVLFCICFEYKDYGGEYHCWLQMDTSLMLGELIPIAIVGIVALSLIEAAGASDYKPLDGVDQAQLLSAQISQRSNLIILFFVIAHMLTGMYAEYEQNLGLYSIFSILNGVTGGLIFFLHCSANQKLRAKFGRCFKSVTKRGKQQE